MKRSKTVLIVVVVLEFLIILLGVLYLHSSSQKLPAVMVINIDNEIVTSNFYGILENRGQLRMNGTSSNNIIRMLEFFSQDKSIKAFVLEINAYGGQTAGQEELARYIQSIDKPVVAVIIESALASGYYVAASTDKIYAHPSAQVGHIGEAFVYVNRKRDGKEQICSITASNYEYVTLADCPGFDEASFAMLHRHVAITHLTLIDYIAQMRALDNKSIDSLSETVMTSKEALERGFIDKIGTTEDAIAWLENKTETKLWIINLRDMLEEDQR